MSVSTSWPISRTHKRYGWRRRTDSNLRMFGSHWNGRWKETKGCIPFHSIGTRFARSSRKTCRAWRRLQKKIHTHTRFFFDQNFPRDKCKSLYATWIRRSCEDYADQVLTAHADGQAVGYITCKRLKDDEGQIGLFGVERQARGRGIGRSLVYAALDWFASKSIQTVRVVTQGRNISAQRLYQSCGFLTHSIQLWYHRWVGKAG